MTTADHDAAKAGKRKRWSERHQMPAQALHTDSEGHAYAMLWCKRDGILRETFYPYTVKMPHRGGWVNCRSAKFARLLARSIHGAEYIGRKQP